MLQEGKQAETKIDITPYQRAIRQQLGLPAGFCRGSRIDMRHLTPLDKTQLRKIFLEQFFKAAITRLQAIDKTINAGCLKGQVSRARLSHQRYDLWGKFFILLSVIFLSSVVPAAIYRKELEFTGVEYHTNSTTGKEYTTPTTLQGAGFFYAFGPVIAILLCCFAVCCLNTQNQQPAFEPSAHLRLSADDNAILTELNTLLNFIDTIGVGLAIDGIQLDAKEAEPPRHELPQRLIKKCEDHLKLLAKWVNVPAVAEGKGKQGKSIFISPSPSAGPLGRGLKTSQSLLIAFNHSPSGYHALEDEGDRGIPLSVSVVAQNTQAVALGRAIDQIYERCIEQLFPTLGAAYRSRAAIVDEEENGIPRVLSINGERPGA